MIIFGGVDGTGVWNNDEYDRQMEFSFVRTLCKGWTDGPALYQRGPTTEDWRLDRATWLCAKNIYNHVTFNWKPGRAVFLAGYSRGGAAVIEASKWLKGDNIPVECLILFDAVDRTGQVGLPWQNTPIADTVKTVIYAKRMWSTRSRESFGNCGLWMESGKQTPYKEFFATHAGLGGVPWPIPAGKTLQDLIYETLPDRWTNVTYERDRAGANEVQTWSFNLIENALSECRERLKKRPYLPGPPEHYLPPQKPSPGNGQRIHVVQQGDWLSKIAITYYGDMNKWDVIYKANIGTIGPNPDLIIPGQQLVIP